MAETFLRPTEVARACGVSRQTIYKLIADGELPSVRIGNSVRVPADELHAYLAARRRPGRTSVQVQATSSAA